MIIEGLNLCFVIGKKRKKEKKRTAYYRVKITIKNITIDSFKIRLILKFLLKEESLNN